MMRALKRISLIGVGLVVIGFTGLLIAIRAYPNSNLLGGWGLILGPVYWLGLLVCFLAALAWIIVGLLVVLRRLRGGRKNDRGDSASGVQRD
jgi:hypothetical protein